MSDDRGAPFVIEPAFLDGDRGRLFSVYVAPRDTQSRGGLLLAPAFADEQNKSRHVVSAMARDLAADGYATMLADTYGTGDSEGDFVDGRWNGWLDDLQAAAEELSRRCQAPIAVWGVRCGALLAADLMARNPERFGVMLLWNPILRGSQVVNELGRLERASELVSGAGASGTGGQDARSDAAESREVAGYRMSPALLDGLRESSLVARAPRRCKVLWIDVARDPERTASPAVGKAVTALEDAGSVVHRLQVGGPAFWNSVELEWPVALMQATRQLLAANFR